jgi:hypothetical protein
VAAFFAFTAGAFFAGAALLGGVFFAAFLTVTAFTAFYAALAAAHRFL